MENELLIVIIGFIVVFSAALIQGTVSFGFSLLAVPLLGIIMPLKIAVPMLIVFSLIMNSVILYKIKDYVNLRKIAILIVSAVIATPLGANMLIHIDEQTLQMIVGIIVTLSAISMYFGYKVKFKNDKFAFIPVGILSGLLNGSVSLSGPPVILFLTNQGVDKQTFRATLTAYFWILNIMTVVTYIYKGLITKDVLMLTGYLLPALIIGVILGISLGNKVKESLFDKLTIFLIAGMGSLSIISAL